MPDEAGSHCVGIAVIISFAYSQWRRFDHATYHDSGRTLALASADRGTSLPSWIALGGPETVTRMVMVQTDKGIVATPTETTETMCVKDETPR